MTGYIFEDHRRVMPFKSRGLGNIRFPYKFDQEGIVPNIRFTRKYLISARLNLQDKYILTQLTQQC